LQFTMQNEFELDAEDMGNVKTLVDPFAAK